MKSKCGTFNVELLEDGKSFRVQRVFYGDYQRMNFSFDEYESLRDCVECARCEVETPQSTTTTTAAPEIHYSQPETLPMPPGH